MKLKRIMICIKYHDSSKRLAISPMPELMRSNSESFRGEVGPSSGCEPKGTVARRSSHARDLAWLLRRELELEVGVKNSVGLGLELVSCEEGLTYGIRVFLALLHEAVRSASSTVASRRSIAESRTLFRTLASEGTVCQDRPAYIMETYG